MTTNNEESEALKTLRSIDKNQRELLTLARKPALSTRRDGDPADQQPPDGVRVQDDSPEPRVPAAQPTPATPPSTPPAEPPRKSSFLGWFLGRDS
jgi:hypothetical protein